MQALQLRFQAGLRRLQTLDLKILGPHVRLVLLQTLDVSLLGHNLFFQPPVFRLLSKTNTGSDDWDDTY
jgi:hypothetical protein